MAERLKPQQPNFQLNSDVLTSLQNGDETQWTNFYRHYIKSWHNFTRRRGFSREETNDITSTTTAKIYRRVCGAPFEGNLEAYPWNALHNTVRSARRARNVRRVEIIPIDPLLNEDGREDGEDAMRIFADSTPGPEETLIEMINKDTKKREIIEMKREFNKVLKKIPPQYAKVLKMRQQGIPDEEIAAKLDKSVNAVRILATRAAERIRLFTAA